MVCPFINGDDNRCGEKLKLDCIDFAVEVCGDDFTQCAIFWEIVAARREAAQREAAPAA